MSNLDVCRLAYEGVIDKCIKLLREDPKSISAKDNVSYFPEVKDLK